MSFLSYMGDRENLLMNFLIPKILTGSNFWIKKKIYLKNRPISTNSHLLDDQACFRSKVMIVGTRDYLNMRKWAKYWGVVIGDLINNSVKNDDKNLTQIREMDNHVISRGK